ncbi:poly(R)-hydroxyalkanoic acid synthase subunit PhaE [Chitinophagaceae bacterium MMS25-I14]
MANQDSKNFVENIVNAQKQMVDTMVENTSKFTNGNTLIADTMQKGSEWYKNWLDNQTNTFSKTAEQAGNATETVKENTTKMNEFYQNWFNTQMGWAKQMWEMNQNFVKQAQQTTDTNPMNQWSNMMSNWNNNWSNWMNGMNTMNAGNNWMNQMQQMNPFNMDAWKKGSENTTSVFNQWHELMNNSFGEWHKNIQNGTAQDAYRNMVNVQEGFTRFYEMWAPMWKSIQEKTFNSDLYKQWMNPVQYKDLMDKFFGFMPENSRQYLQNFTTMMQDNMKQAGGMGMNGFQQMRNMFGAMPGMNGTDFFTNMLNGYNNWYQMANNSISPIVRMMTPNQQTKSLIEWNDIANRMMVYNIKNAELQFMIYTQGTKVMDQLAENIISKIQNGEEVTSVMAMYQEWLNLSDKVYVSLFESDTYSQLMAEVSALQLRLRKDMEHQMEKMMTGLPVATRSEMDEMYKTIYDLKKQVRQLEKMLELNTEDETEATTAAKEETKAKGGKKA